MCLCVFRELRVLELSHEGHSSAFFKIFLFHAFPQVQICKVATVAFIPDRFSVEELFCGENVVVCEHKLSVTAI